MLGDRFLRDLGLRRYEIQINSIGDETCRPAYREELVAFLEANRDRLRDEHKDRFRENPLRVLDCKDEACRAVAAEAPRIIDHLCEPCREHFARCSPGWSRRGSKPVVTPTLVRGLDYYTRTAFEFVSDALAEGASAQQSTLFGGGRYDGLAEALGGPHVPGVGFGMGLERVALAIADEGLAAPEEPGLRAFVVTIGEPARELGRRLVGDLRAAGARRGDAVRGAAAEGAAEDGRPRRGRVRGDHRRAGGRGRDRDAEAARRRRTGHGADRRGAAHACGRARHDRGLTDAHRDALAHVRRAPRVRRRRAGGALRLDRAPPRPRRRDVHRPPRPGGRDPGRVPPGGRARRHTRRRRSSGANGSCGSRAPSARGPRGWRTRRWPPARSRWPPPRSRC